MSRYIDADELKDTHYNYATGELVPLAWADIENAPHINIVRCKECVKRMREDCPMCNCCKLDRVPTEDNDFCSYGERRES